MKKLSKNEWIAVVMAILFVSYTFFGSNIMSMLFKNGENNTSAIALSQTENTGPIIINDVSKGSGLPIEDGKLISMHYILSLEDGTVVQSSRDLGYPFKFIAGEGDVIAGFEKGIRGMKVGGVRSIIIPAEFAYGPNQVGPIPPNSTLIFTVELLDVSSVPTN